MLFLCQLHFHPQPGLAEELELGKGSFPREETETPFRGKEICLWPREVEGWKGRLPQKVGAMGCW